MKTKLGNPPPHGRNNPLGVYCSCIDCFAHRHISMLEAADELHDWF